MSVFTTNADNEDAILSVDKVFREAVPASIDKALAPVDKAPGEEEQQEKEIRQGLS